VSRDCQQQTGAAPKLSIKAAIPILGDSQVIVFENLVLVQAKEVVKRIAR
jgi:hypothetical protein